jgi:hypothetical protein
VGAELVGDQDTRRAGLLADELAQQAFGGPRVAAALNQGVKHEAILIDGAPKPMVFAIDGDDDFIEMAPVPKLRCTPTDFVGKVSAEFLDPPPNRFVAHHNSARANRSSTIPRLRGKRKYSQTAWATTSRRVRLWASFAQVRCDHRPEMIYPAPDGFVGDCDPTFRQQILDVAQAQGNRR